MMTVRPLTDDTGYGLLLSVYFNEQTLFDELYEYVGSCLDANGLMNWQTVNGRVTGQTTHRC